MIHSPASEGFVKLHWVMPGFNKAIKARCLTLSRGDQKEMNAPMAFIDELHEEKVQSFREVVEEAAKAPPRKSKKKMKWGG